MRSSAPLLLLSFLAGAFCAGCGGGGDDQTTSTRVAPGLYVGTSRVKVPAYSAEQEYVSTAVVTADGSVQLYAVSEEPLVSPYGAFTYFLTAGRLETRSAQMNFGGIVTTGDGSAQQGKDAVFRFDGPSLKLTLRADAHSLPELGSEHVQQSGEYRGRVFLLSNTGAVEAFGRASGELLSNGRLTIEWLHATSGGSSSGSIVADLTLNGETNNEETQIDGSLSSAPVTWSSDGSRLVVSQTEGGDHPRVLIELQRQ